METRRCILTRSKNETCQVLGSRARARTILLYPHLFLVSNLNSLSLGWTKQEFLQNFSADGPGCTGGIWAGCDGAIVRAAQVGKDGVLTEVLTVNMAPLDFSTVQHWFLFRNNVLVQWGRPEDWQAVSARYEVNFNPGPAVRP